MTSDNVKAGIMLGAVGLAALIAWKLYKTGSSVADSFEKTVDTAKANVEKAAQTVGGWVDVRNDTNLIYRGVNAVGGAVAGSSDWSLGGAIYDWTHPDVFTSTTATAAARADADRVAAASPQYDAMGNYLGDYQTTNTGGATGRW